MDYSPPTPASNVTSDTQTRHDVPRSPPLPQSSLALLRTWSERVVGASLDVWSMFPTQMQIDAVTSLVDVDVCGGKLLLIVKTGAGKSHVMRTTGVLLGGVCLIIMPLLALGSDQVSKLTSASQAFGPVQYFHLDEYRTRPQNML
jgi:superfamily II DNA or RNA helicase